MGERGLLNSWELLRRQAAEKTVKARDLIQEQTWLEVYTDHTISKKLRLAWIRSQNAILQHSRSPAGSHLYEILQTMSRIVEASNREDLVREYVFFLAQLLIWCDDRDLEHLAEFVWPYLDRIEALSDKALSWEDWVQAWPVEETGESLLHWVEILGGHHEDLLPEDRALQDLSFEDESPTLSSL